MSNDAAGMPAHPSMTKMAIATRTPAPAAYGTTAN
jgi:hypothetical protein